MRLPHRSVGDRVSVPLVWYTLEEVRFAGSPLDAGSDERVSHRLAHEDLSGRSEPRYSRSDVYRQTGVVVALALDFTQVQAGSHVEPKLGCLGSDGSSCVDRYRRLAATTKKSSPRVFTSRAS